MRAEHERGAAGRFGPGLPRISDGQLLFPAAHAGAREGPEGRRLAHRDHHERLAALHRRRGQRRERDPPLHPRERPARGADRAAGAALLQHRHRHLRLGRHQPQGARAPRQGAAHRRHVVLGADAQEPRRQAPRDPARARAGHPEDPRRLQGRRHAHGHQGRQGGESSSAGSSRRRTSASARSRWSARCASTSRPARSASRASKRSGGSRRSRSRRRRAPPARRSRPKGARSRRRSASSSARSRTRCSRTATSSSACSTPPRRKRA